MTNRLARETSPYLLQHAENPVDWYAWGEEALARAKAEDRPIFLSIGYAACHWCHVMEKESFENEAIARLLNQHFVSIKVDREERPDLDDIYMAATLALSGSGGWPMSVFLLPDRRPFFAGTYFPPEGRYGRPGFSTLLTRIAELYRTRKDDLVREAGELSDHVRAGFAEAAPGAVARELVATAASDLARVFDAKWGGFGAAPKFPPCASLALLLRHHRRTGDEKARTMLKTTLDAMKDGGIYDQLGGGFARYSTDERWLVPHFEKMLYDNAELARVFVQAWQVTKDPEYRRVASETLDYVVREMQGTDGGYFSATDADSEGEEGKFFVWALDEIQAVLETESADHFAFFYDVTAEGNWEGKNILHRRHSVPEAGAALGLEPALLEASLAESRRKLYAARLERVPPLLDDKVITAWNGLMIGAMALGYQAFGNPRYLESAERAARFAQSGLVRPDGGLYRTSRGGRAHLSAYLEDYAFLADGLVGLYEAGGAAEFLTLALTLAERMLKDFGAEGGSLFSTASDHEELVARPREGHDGAIPSANAVAARVLARLGRHFGRDDFSERARAAIDAYGGLIARAPRGFPTSLAVVDFLEAEPAELALVGRRGSAEREAFEAALGQHYLPNHVIGHLDPSAPDATSLPLLEGKTLVGERAALYVCRSFACQAPLTDPNRVAGALAS